MKHFEKVILCLAAGLLLHEQARAVATEGNNPYANIVDRNVFGLRPPPPPPEAPKPEVKLSPITLQGIVNAFGKKQVLFKTTVAAKPGEAPKETSFVMSENERVGEIEVLEINDSAGTVRFRNQGVDLVRDLSKDSAKPPNAPPPAVPTPPPGNANVPGFTRPPGAITKPTGAIPPPLPDANNTKVTIPRPMRMNAAPAPPPVPSTAPAPQPDLSADEQALLREVARKLNAGKDVPPLPPSEQPVPQP